MKVSLCILGKGIPSGQIFIHLTSGTQAVFQLPTVSLDEGTFVHAHTTHMYTADLSHILKNSRFQSQEEKTSPRPSNENTINFKIVSLIFNLCIIFFLVRQRLVKIFIIFLMYYAAICSFR